MAKVKTTFTCQSCGAEFPKWQGKCFECGAWNSLVESVAATRKSQGLTKAEPQALSRISTMSYRRLATGYSEFNRVLGGAENEAGIVPGSVILLAGEPGIGKSTLLLQIAASTAQADEQKNKETEEQESSLVSQFLSSSVLYVSGEESVEQLKLRADRLGLDSEKVFTLPETDVDVIGETISRLVGLTEKETAQPPNRPTVNLLIIDSIQTLKTSDLTSAAGSISQVQECARRLSQLAKNMNLPLILVGHITKGGIIAGPKALEHLVDVVLYLEGERFNDFRILRGIKNRFGQTSEIGIFRMMDKGMAEVKNPSTEMLSTRKQGVPGSVLTVTIEGQRPLLLEIQTLTSRTAFGLPRRTVNGIDYNRLLMLLAVLQKRVGLSFVNQDVYVNVAGGFKSSEPALDLAICLSLASSLKNKVLPKDVLAIGEVGLLGEIKQPPRFEERIREAKKLGFTKIITHTAFDSIKEAIKEATGY
ncbi:MAG: DNA repair protein RadA [Candidatus Cloacimonetes bacterium]|nr:DNA repair protein RadA [Candidatus Cloacimonadota bacterium]